MPMADVHIPADYAIDALSMEAERRRKQKGLVRYSYGQLVADTTPAERETIAEDYRQKLIRAQKKGKYRVSGGVYQPRETSVREVEDRITQKLEGMK